MASTEEIKRILEDLRLAIDKGKFTPISRRKNMRTLAQLGLTWEDAKDEIRSLSEKDYQKGPEADRDRPMEDKLWVFKKRVCGEVIYIKFKVLYQEDGSVKVISFHIDE